MLDCATRIFLSAMQVLESVCDAASSRAKIWQGRCHRACNINIHPNRKLSMQSPSKRRLHEVDDHLGGLSPTGMDDSRIVSSANSGVSETTDLEVFLQLFRYTWVKSVPDLRSCICACSVCVRLTASARLHLRGLA